MSASSCVDRQFYVPESVSHPVGEFSQKKIREMVELIKYRTIKSYDNYHTLVDNDVDQKVARMILPQNMMTLFYMKGNLRNWMEYCKVRCSKVTDSEHKRIALKVHKKLLTMFPVAVGALSWDAFSANTLSDVGLRG